MNRYLTEDTKAIINLSEKIYILLSEQSNDLDQILKLMDEREKLMNQMMPSLDGQEKQNFVELLSMIRDKEMIALIPYRAQLNEVEESILAVNKVGQYQCFGGNGA